MPDAPRVTIDELNRRMEAGEPVTVLDVRRASYDESDVKVAGAVRIEPDALEQEYRRLPQGPRVVTYCT